MKRFTLLLGLLAVPLLTLAGAAQEKEKPPDKPPTHPIVVTPLVHADPVAADSVPLADGQVFVFRAKRACSVKVYPPGIVTIRAAKGPIWIDAVFTDGKADTREFVEPFVWIVKAAATGRAYIVATPYKFETDSEVWEQIVDCNVGPRPPPPGPDPSPDPKPGPVSPTKLFVIVVEETAALAAERGKLFSDKALNARFAEKGHKWRIVDKDVVGPDGHPPKDIAGYLTAASGKALPQVFLVDPTGKLLYTGNLPRTAPELLATIQKVGG